MSKYLQKGCYHFQEFANPNTTYAKHVDDLMDRIAGCFGPGRRRAHEVGCGEGLILDQLKKQLDWVVTGHDIDEIAFSMARRLLYDSSVYKSAPPGEFDVILFCDSLEHMKTWPEQLEWAKRSARQGIVIAVPDRHDPHGEQDFKPDFADTILSGWEIAHRATRHARHLTIWKKPCAI